MIMIYCYTLARQESLITLIIWKIIGVYNNSHPVLLSPPQKPLKQLTDHWTFSSAPVYHPTSFGYDENFNKF